MLEAHPNLTLVLCSLPAATAGLYSSVLKLQSLGVSYACVLLTCGWARSDEQAENHAGKSQTAELQQSPAADPFAHCIAHSPLAPTPALMRSVSRAEATLPRLQPEEFASPLASGLRYGIMSHISQHSGFSPGSSQQVRHTPAVLHAKRILSERL